MPSRSRAFTIGAPEALICHCMGCDISRIRKMESETDRAQKNKTEMTVLLERAKSP